MKVILAALAIGLAAAGPAAALGMAGGTAPSIGRGSPDALHPDRAQELIARKVGQMILVGFAGTSPDDAATRRVARMIGEGRIGGVVLFGENIRSPAQLRRLTAALLAARGAIPPFIAIDQEGGRIQRLPRNKGFIGLPSARAVARMNLLAAALFYLRTARELAALDINLNFGPVLDLDTNPASPAIGRKARSYGRDPATVAAYARQFIATHRFLGVLTAAKHFPGHGSAIGDTHDRPVDISASWRADELKPYGELAGEGSLDMIMVGHLTHPRFSDGDRPASLSRRTLTVEIREALGFDGLIVTDDLGMSAVTRRFRIEEAAVMAVAAGADIVLVANAEHPEPSVADAITAAIVAAISAGRIPEEAIDRSFARILRAKAGIAWRLAPPPGE